MQRKLETTNNQTAAMSSDVSSDASSEDWTLLTQLTHAYRGLLDGLMDRIGLHRAQVNVLCRLFEQDGMTQSEIAEQLSVQGATITNMLQRMEEAGLVTRRRDPVDNRLVRVYLTDMGREQERAITEQAMRVEQSVFEGLNAEERATLRRMMRLMLDNMDSES
jgi:MarR family transcriptional regulator, organic hydroperoxide resistance regulator